MPVSQHKYITVKALSALSSDPYSLNIIDFDVNLAYLVGSLRPLTKGAGLSLGDRACLALAQRLGLPALTTDRAWKDLSLDIEVRVIL